MLPDWGPVMPATSWLAQALVRGEMTCRTSVANGHRRMLLFLRAQAAAPPGPALEPRLAAARTLAATQVQPGGHPPSAFLKTSYMPLSGGPGPPCWRGRRCSFGGPVGDWCRLSSSWDEEV